MEKENLALEARKITGLTQEEFAEVYRIPLSTLRKHEQRAHLPRNVVKLYYQLIITNSSAVHRILEELAREMNEKTA